MDRDNEIAAEVHNLIISDHIFFRKKDIIVRHAGLYWTSQWQ